MERTVCARMVRGPLARSAWGFEGELVRRGYALGSVRGHLRQLDDLSCWLERRGLVPDELTSEWVDLFLRERRAAGDVRWVSLRSMSLPLGICARPVSCQCRRRGPEPTSRRDPPNHDARGAECRRRRTSESRVRENRMHDSKWRREETRPVEPTRSRGPGASRRPYHSRRTRGHCKWRHSAFD
jgi:hypothetical protein